MGAHMSGYNYDNFSADKYDLQNFHAPKPGDKAPDVTVSDIDGTEHRLIDFDGDFLVLEAGSITCPLFQSRRDGMRALTEKYPDTAFAILYVREAHPGAARPQHKTQADKVADARALRDVDGEGRRILVDSINGDAHAVYGKFPNSVVIINRNGCVVYTSDWNNPRATGLALAALKAGKPATRAGLFLPARPPVAIRTLKGAGAGAGRDFLRSLPVLIWHNLIRRNWRILTGRNPQVLPDTMC